MEGWGRGGGTSRQRGMGWERSVCTIKLAHLAGTVNSDTYPGKWQLLNEEAALKMESSLVRARFTEMEERRAKFQSCALYAGVDSHVSGLSSGVPRGWFYIIIRFITDMSIFRG